MASSLEPAKPLILIKGSRHGGMLKRSNHSIHLNWIRYPNQQLSVEHDAGDGTSISAAALAAGHAGRISRGAAPRLEQKQGERGHSRDPLYPFLSLPRVGCLFVGGGKPCETKERE